MAAAAQLDYQSGVNFDQRVVIFIPAWNEANNIGAVIDEIRSDIGAVDVLVVDDGSTDGTASIARDRGAHVVSFEENRGLRAAIAKGYSEALGRGYVICGRVDADGQHPAAELARLLDLVARDECDVAVGSRFASDSNYDDGRYEPSLARKFGIGLLQSALAVRLGQRFHDPTSGMVAANASGVRVLAEPYQSGAPEVEALLRLRQDGLRVEEVPVDMRERQHGESKLRGRKAFALVGTVIATLVLFGLRRRRRLP